jgi:hypothetical protein
VSCPRPLGSGTRSATQSHAITRGDAGGPPAMMADVGEVEVVVAHHERATLRVGSPVEALRAATPKASAVRL